MDFTNNLECLFGSFGGSGTVSIEAATNTIEFPLVFDFFVFFLLNIDIFSFDLMSLYDGWKVGGEMGSPFNGLS